MQGEKKMKSCSLDRFKTMVNPIYNLILNELKNIEVNKKTSLVKCPLNPVIRCDSATHHLMTKPILYR